MLYIYVPDISKFSRMNRTADKTSMSRTNNTTSKVYKRANAQRKTHLNVIMCATNIPVNLSHRFKFSSLVTRQPTHSLHKCKLKQKHYVKQPHGFTIHWIATHITSSIPRVCCVQTYLCSSVVRCQQICAQEHNMCVLNVLLL